MKWILALLFSVALSAQAEPVLRWGADLESGAPFSFKDPENPEKIVGFEAEIVHAVAAKLGMRVEFFQNNWEGLIEGLKRSDYDIVVNGLEITEDRREVVDFTRPYYVTAEVLTVPRTTNTIAKLEDAAGKRIGTLTGSLAQRILSEQKFPFDMVTYSEEMHIYNDLSIGRIDAVFLDEPIALYYAKPNPALKILGGHIGRMDYGIASRKGEALSAKLDRAVGELIQDGTIRKILERWGLWNDLTATEWKVTVPPETPAVEYERYLKTAFAPVSWFERFKRYAGFMPLLAKASLMTLEISIVSMALAMLVGLFTALARLYGPSPARWLAVAFVEIFRGTPLLIQLFLIFYGLPHIGIKLDPFTSAILGLGLNYGASEAENYRAGILSIPKAQMDASFALGMTRRQSLRHIILPQAVRLVIPPVTNDFIALLKDSSLVSVITMVELTATYGQLASTYFDYLGIGLLTAAVYFIIGLPFVRLSRHLEHNLDVSRKPPTGTVTLPS